MTLVLVRVTMPKVRKSVAPDAGVVAEAAAAHDVMSRFSLPAREWFEATLGAPTRAQTLGFGPILDRQSTLLLAPTGSGKTLAAFLSALDTLMHTPEPSRDSRCRVLYVSPLKALAVDIERNLRAPLAGIAEAARRLEHAVRLPSVAVRSGDTPQAERARMRRTPPDILITTPESLFLLLTSESRHILGSVETVIIDEIHSLVPTKRGAHLFLSLERLEALANRATGSALQRIGLSATQRPLDEVARLLGGRQSSGAPRPVTIIDAQQKKPLALRVELPPPTDISAAVPDASDRLKDIASGPAAAGPRGKSIWPAVHQRLLELIKQHRTTMIFVNSRRLAERLASAVNELAGEELALAHHGSVAREKRVQIEERLKLGQLPAIVATSSLELGLDIGSVDLVVQIESPPSIASGLQRIGRAHHQVGGTPSGVVIAKHRADLMAAAAASARMLQGDVEETFYPRNPLDVLAQQIVAMCAVQAYAVDELLQIIRRAAPFAELPDSAFEGVLDMLAGRYPSDAFAELRPRIVWDRVGGTVRARTGALRLAVTNAGTIPDRGLYGVFLAGSEGGKGGKRVGELDEEMVFELREGEVFLLGASSWRAESISHDRVLVTPAPGEPGKMPFWHGDRPGRPRAFGIAIGELTRSLAESPQVVSEVRLREEHRLDAASTEQLVGYVREQVEASGTVPSDRGIVIERFLDEIGDHRVCVLSPFGSRVHAPWATAVATRLREQRLGDIESVYSDDGMVFRIPASDEPPAAELFLPPSDEVQALVTRALEGTSLFAARFRESAGRALLLPRKSPLRRQPLWAQRKRAADLLAVAAQHPSFPIVLETYRECLRDVFDLPGLLTTLRDIEARRLKVTVIDSATPSPFAASLLFSFVANFIYEGDAPLAERRAQALTIDHERLRELLGETEQRSLLDAEVIEAHERSLQRLEYPAKHADALSDVLRAIGDLTADEVALRCDPSDAAADWLAELERERRVIRVRINKETRFAAVEDAGRLRDALGVSLPQGLPAAFLEAVPGALEPLLVRYARTHGPFDPAVLMARYGVAHASVEEVMLRLLRSGQWVRGAFLPGGQHEEVCDAEVLRVLRRRSLARLRREVEPVEPVVLGRFLAEWQGVRRPGRGEPALLEAVAQLQGCPIPASSLLYDVLPARVVGFNPSDLNALCASGQVVWAGVDAIGPSDGRVALYLAEHEALLARPPTIAATPAAAAIRALLERRGAVFFDEIARTVGGFPPEVLATLWDMVWAGEVTNDTLDPLRSLLRGDKRESARDRLRGRARPSSLTRPTIAGSEGRWSLRSARWADAPSDTDRRTALARALLDRYGIVTREVAHAEGIAGGFSAVYDVLKAMEDAGRIRRGYFVAGHGGAQFALPGADERLRARRSAADAPDVLVLAAVDPANPYGATLSWPGASADAARLQRAAGAYVILYDGSLVGYLSRSGQSLHTFSAVAGSASEPERAGAMAALARALAAWASASRRRAFYIATIDGADARVHPLASEFLSAGFVDGGRGLLLRSHASAIAAEATEEAEVSLVDAGG